MKPAMYKVTDAQGVTNPAIFKVHHYLDVRGISSAGFSFAELQKPCYDMSPDDAQALIDRWNNNNPFYTYSLED